MRTAVIAVSLAVACLVALVRADAQCLDVSWAVNAVTTLSQSTVISGFNGNGPATLQEGIDPLWAIIKTQSSGFWPNLYYGLQDGSFFGLKNCRVQETGYNVFCPSQNMTMVAYIQHPVLLGNPHRSVFALSPEGQILYLIGNTSDVYDWRLRPWHNQTGWTPQPFAFAGGGYGKTFAQTFSTFTVAGDRLYREPCDACLMTSYCVPASLSLAQMNVESWAEVTSSTQLPAIMSTLMGLALKVDRGYTATLYIGFANDYFYGVRDCTVALMANMTSCQLMKQLYPDAKWYFQYQNSAINADGYLRAYPVTIDNSVPMSPTFTMNTGFNLRINDTAPYRPTQRPWYLTIGWSDLVTYFGSTSQARTYSSPATMNTGMIPAALQGTTLPPATVGADHVDEEPCWNLPGIMSAIPMPPPMPPCPPPMGTNSMVNTMSTTDATTGTTTASRASAAIAPGLAVAAAALVFLKFF